MFIDTDYGIRVVRHPEFRKRYPNANIRYEQFTDPVDENGLFTEASGFWGAINFLNEIADDDSVRTIVVDSLTSFQELAMHVGMELSGQHNRSKTLERAQMSKKHGGVPVALPTQADYGSEMSAFQQFMDQAVTIPKNMLFLAHERVETNSQGITLSKDPLLIGNRIRAMIARWFDEVWYLQAGDDGTRELITDSERKLKSVKSRLGLPSPLENPDYHTIKEEIDALS